MASIIRSMRRKSTYGKRTKPKKAMTLKHGKVKRGR